MEQKQLETLRAAKIVMNSKSKQAAFDLLRLSKLISGSVTYAEFAGEAVEK